MEPSSPPTYEQAVGDCNPCKRNGISPSARRSMEDEARPLPAGWTRCFDTHYAHQYFVDTTANPPRSIWHHPFDDSIFVDSLTPAERDNLKQQGLLGHNMRMDDVLCESTDEERGSIGAGGRPKEKGKSRLAKVERSLKDRLTHSTHAERQARRRRRAAEEEDAHRSYKLFRQGLEDAMRTGEPQMLGVDDDGREVYLQPPGAVYAGEFQERSLSPFVTELVYSPGAGPQVGNKNARFVRADGIYGTPGRENESSGFPGMFGYGAGGGVGRPASPYSRPHGGGFGGGVGLPFALPLMGGVVLGGLVF